MNFNDWAPLRLVDSELLKRVRLAFVFGKTGHEAFLITNEDEVLACGSNFQGCLGLENIGPVSTPLPIPELCKKRVKGFSYCFRKEGSVLVFALTYCGQVYYWGQIYTSTNATVTPTPIESFSKKVSEVECGLDHYLILTTDGEVYSWGCNDYGQLGHGTINSPQQKDSYGRVSKMAVVTDCNTPTLVQSVFKNKIVIKISCGMHFSVAVLDNGEVYAWGRNNNGQIGVNSKGSANILTPARVSELNGIIIRQIRCGASHVLAVSDVSELYTWGQNDVGQLGLPDLISEFTFTPTKIETIGKVIDIATTSDSSTSAAMNEQFEVYMWGACEGLLLKEPKETQFETLHEVFAYFGNRRVMYKPMTRQFQFESVSESLKNAFNNVETSDLTIEVEDKKIFVHKAVLRIRSNYFRTMLQESWVQENEKLIKLDTNYDGIYAYLKYIYTGDLKASPEAALELMKIADEYHDLVLKKLCEKLVKYSITEENVADLYILALQLDAKKLAKYCFTFACNHVGELIQTPGFQRWNKDILTEFIVECHKRKKFRF